MNNQIKRVIGFFLVFLGIIGLFLPGLQGVLFITAGLYLIKSERINNFVKKICKKCLPKKKKKKK